MKVNSFNNNTAFGWNIKTHKQITSMVVDEFQNLQEFKPKLKVFSEMPSQDERGFKGNAHFCYPVGTIRPRLSFLDFSGKQNAAAKYLEHVVTFRRTVNKDNSLAMEHAGRALHFLQDMTQPLHIKRGNFLQKFLENPVHKSFENYALKKSDVLVENSKPIALDYTHNDLKDLFDEVYSITESFDVPKGNNTKKWHNIAQDGFNNAISATREFLKIVSQSLK